MRKLVPVLLLLLGCAFAPPAARADWRFGYEWNENWPWSPREDGAQVSTLLDKLAAASPGAAVNINGMRGWGALQARAGGPINFAPTDQSVRIFQQHGLELTWYLNCNARWAWVDPKARVAIGASMAPAPAYEDDWQALVRAVVERYDGDGVADMPGLTKPIRFYILTGEVRFDRSGLGDRETPPFWADTIPHLLRLHRLTYQAIRQADPSGKTKLVGSGALLWDLYGDFPDYPQFDPPQRRSTIRQRLAGANFKGSDYRQGWSGLKQLLASYGNDADGIECDYVGWHPHFSWRVIDQELALLRSLTHGKKIYVDDMWTNLFAIGYSAIPGEAQFTASRQPSKAWVQALWGDFPNPLFTGNDPYGQLYQRMNAGNAPVLAWYETKGAHQLVKGFATAFGEGAERVSFSGTNDTYWFGIQRGWELGWLNLLGTWQESYREKPQYWSFKSLVELLRDFTGVRRLAVSLDPRTRAYRFARPRGPLIVAWSETGSAPPGLDYSIPTGETVTLALGNARARLLALPDRAGVTAPVSTEVDVPGGALTVRLGYRPLLIEEVP